jgi:hypothetical protein
MIIQRTNFRVLICALIPLQCLDGVSTLMGQHVGLTESNPLLVFWGDLIGPEAAIVMAKLISMGVLFLMWPKVTPVLSSSGALRYSVLGLWLSAVALYVCVVLGNIWQIAEALHRI